jgi:hypothetical protein
MRNLVVLVIFAFGTINGLFAQRTSVQDLDNALRAGQVSLTANGNGGSSGGAVDGFLRNRTSNELWINIYIDQGVYLVNSGSGQNMVGTQIYLGGGMYSFDGSREFIILPPQTNTEVEFVAFCANLERDNPSSGENFSIGSMPSEITTMAAKINRYMREHSDDEDAIIVAQVALWRAQGKTESEIGQHFEFTPADWNNAGILLNY